MLCTRLPLPGSFGTDPRDCRKPLSLASSAILTSSPVDPYPLPDIAVLRLDSPGPAPPGIASLSADPPGEDLWGYGYPEEYWKNHALGHPVRFAKVGAAQVADDDARLVWRVEGDRVRPGMSGGPVLDLATGKVVGILKRAQESALGAWFVPLEHLLSSIEEIATKNASMHRDPRDDEELAYALWGDLVRLVAAKLERNASARAAVVDTLETLTEADLIGDDAAQAGRSSLERSCSSLTLTFSSIA